MTDNRQLIQSVIAAIEDLDPDTLHKCHRLELLLPQLYEAIIIDDECVHSYNDQGICICGSTRETK